MKKSLLKAMSVLLSMVVLLSALSLPAFAAECNECSTYAVEICNHLYRTTVTTKYEVYSSEYHMCIETINRVCATCGMTNNTETTSLEEHIVHTWTLIYQDDDIIQYQGTCQYCGYELILTIWS